MGVSSTSVLLSTVAFETCCRRMRLIHHTVADIGAYFDVDPHKLGQGAFGYVCMGASRETGVTRAVKSLSKARAAEVRKRYRQEILIMKMTDHPNIIKLFETFEDKGHLFLVMELCTGGDLMDRLQAVGHFEEDDASVLMQQILRPVYYMHSKGICHRDIKPDNFLFLNKAAVARNTLKIIDFGLSCQYKEGQIMTTKLGTPAYSSPQVFAGQYNESCDLWSSGVMLYFLLAGHLPFQGRSDVEIMQNVKRGNYAFQGSSWELVSEGAKDMVRKLLKYNPQERSSAQQALQHRFIRTSSGNSSNGLALMLTPSLLMDLRSFCSQSLLRRAALQVVATQLSQEETDILRRAFEALDNRGAGVLTVKELKASMDDQSLGDLRPEFEQVVMELTDAEAGASDSTEIGFTDFLAATLEAKHFQKEGACRAAFRAFDRDGDGRITQQELTRVLIGDGDADDMWQSTDVAKFRSHSVAKRSSAEVRDLLRGVDANGDGVIDFNEFKLMLQGEKISAV